MYSVKEGETLEIISKKLFGSENFADRIRKSNPGVPENLKTGTVLFIPDIPEKPKSNIFLSPSDDIDQVTLMINGTRYKGFDGLTINTRLGQTDTISFNLPFDYSKNNFSKNFKPFSFSPVACFIGGQPFFNGFIHNITPQITEKSKMINISCQSKPGILQTACMPSSAFPLEYQSQNVQQIAQSLCEPFGIEIENSNTNTGASFEKVSMNPEETIFPFLSGLCKQRNLTIMSTKEGKLKIIRINEKSAPVARIEPGKTNGIISARFSPNQYYSHITGISPSKPGRKGDQFTIRNPFLQNILKPYNFQANDTNNADLRAAVVTKAARMFGNMVSYDVGSIPGWRTKKGNLYNPGDIVTVNSPDAMINRDYDFMIRGIKFIKTKSSQICELELCLPCIFSDNIPEALPWD